MLISRNDKIISRNDKPVDGHAAYLCKKIDTSFMAKKSYHDSAMDYAAWYLEHLLKMEDVMGQQLESKISQMIDLKIRQYLERRADNAQTETRI